MTEKTERDYTYLTAASGPSKEQLQAETDAALAAFLANGGKIQQLDYRQSGRVEGDSYNPWGAGRKKKTTESPLAAPPDEE